MGWWQTVRRAPRVRAVWLLTGVAVLALARPALAQLRVGETSSIVVDAASGRILSAAEADAERYPASLTKLMTLYMVFDALRAQRVRLTDLVPVSAHAAAMEPSKLGLRPGARLTVEQGILALVTKSANDAAAALGEYLGGDEGRFAEMMTLRAHALGMTHTVFRNASGLPDPAQVSTARDLAVLARRIITDFPEDYPYFSVNRFVFHGRLIFNHDMMLKEYPGADGMKTGYTEEAGHNLVTSAVHGGVRLVGVVLGAPSNPARDAQMAGLLNAGFADEGVPQPDASDMRVASVRGFVSHLLIPEAEAATLPRHRKVAVHLGSFRSEHTALQVADGARRGAGGGAVRVVPVVAKGRHFWRAEVLGLSPHQAVAACSAAASAHTACERVASR